MLEGMEIPVSRFNVGHEDLGVEVELQRWGQCEEGGGRERTNLEERWISRLESFGVGRRRYRRGL